MRQEPQPMTASSGPAGAIPDMYLPREGQDPLSGAFERKVGVHAFMSGKPLTGDAALDAYTKLVSRPRSGKSAAYIHFPFCETHCLYCGFFGGKYAEDKADRYLDALIRQLEWAADKPAVGTAPIHALYFGGGTPTALTPAQINRLLGAVHKHLPLANDCEITFEGRIHKFTDEKMRACIDAGVNRFSLGVQSFNTGLRRQLGRIDSRETVIERLEKLASFDQAAVVADLIYGLPGQTLDHWAKDIATFLELPLDGVDLYQLNVFQGGRLAEAIAKGSIPQAADIPMQSRFFALGVELMEQAGMRRLSVSHWGKSTRERNFYNQFTKSRCDSLAFGCGAGGSLDGSFYVMAPDADRYMERVGQGEVPVAMVMARSDGFPLVRTMLGQMETGCLDLSALARVAGQEAADDFLPLLHAWEERGLVRQVGRRFLLSLAGQFWLVNLTQLLLAWHKRTPEVRS